MDNQAGAVRLGFEFDKSQLDRAIQDINRLAELVGEASDIIEKLGSEEVVVPVNLVER